MRNTTDDPTWTRFIYHDHVSWFPGSGYVVEKLFREHFAETYLASTSGTFRDIPDRADVLRRDLADEAGGLAAGHGGRHRDRRTADGRRIVIKAVNYEGSANTLLVRLQGSRVPADATVTIHTISAGLHDAASLEQPDRIKPVERSVEFRPDLTIDLQPYTVAIVEIAAR